MHAVTQNNIVEDAENRHGLRKSKREDVLTRGQCANGTKRAALGAITNQIRVQPSRAAKQFTTQCDPFSGIQDENAGIKPGKGSFAVMETTIQPFTFHTDTAAQPERKLKSTKSAESSKLDLHPAVTSLLHPNVFQSIETGSTESPMVLDESTLELEEPSLTEKPITPESRDELIQTVPEYADDIYQYLRSAEQKNRAKVGYMRKQPDISNVMRSILVDWLVEVAEEYKLHRETLFLSVNYIDRFLSQMSVLRGKLQLVGAACMFLAAKYEEIYPPEVSEFVYITDDTYTKKQVLRMEHLVLKVLSFDVAVPTTNCFCDWYLKRMGADHTTHSLAMYLAELTLVDGELCIKYLPSEIATAAVSLAYHTLHNQHWPSQLEKNSGYTFDQIESCLQDLYKTYCNAATHPQQAINEKYRSAKYDQVSSLSPPPTLPVAMQ